MPADYDKIRAENITRYGTDTAVLDLLGQLYSDRTHFIFELIQNAEDAGARELAFELFDGRLEVRHDGRPFTEADVRGICGVGNSAKSGDLTAIGAFGIGFKSVYAYTQTPSVHSPGEHFRIENYVRPVAHRTAARTAHWTAARTRRCSSSPSTGVTFPRRRPRRRSPRPWPASGSARCCSCGTSSASPSAGARCPPRSWNEPSPPMPRRRGRSGSGGPAMAPWRNGSSGIAAWRQLTSPVSGSRSLSPCALG